VWEPVSKLPKDMSNITDNGNWADLKPFIPPPHRRTTTYPRVFYSESPAELVVFDGRPVYSSVSGTDLVYATNTDARIFVYSPNNTY
jgi:hypothetical protein